MNDQPAVDLPDHVLQYLGEQNTFTLATASPSGVPHASTFLYVNEGPSLYFWTKPTTTTAKHIERNPVVAYAIDQYAEDLTQTKGIQGRGEASVILSGEEIARVAALFGDKFPDLSPGATMSISFFRVVPTEVEFIDNTSSGADTEGDTFGADFHRERAYSVLTDLPLEQIDKVGGALQAVDADAGEVIVRQGGPADKFFIVVDGELEVSREADGQTETVETIGPGQFYGELAIMRDSPRTATLTAKSAAKLLAMERETFRELVAQSLGTTGVVVQERLDTLHG